MAVRIDLHKSGLFFPQVPRWAWICYTSRVSPWLGRTEVSATGGRKQVPLPRTTGGAFFVSKGPIRGASSAYTKLLEADGEPYVPSTVSTQERPPVLQQA